MSVEPRAAGAILTAMLHLLLLVALVQVTASVVEPPQLPPRAETTADALHGAGERVVEVDISPSLSITTTGMPCEGSSYVGVGVTAEPGTERIILVGDNTPASRAGLQHDDIVLNAGVWRDAHREGALLRLLILRNGVQIEVSVLVSKICIGQ